MITTLNKTLRLSIWTIGIAILLFPITVILLYSITDEEALTFILRGIQTKVDGRQWFSSHLDFSTYVQIGLESRKFSTAFLNSVFYSLTTTFGQLLFAVPAAISLSVLKVRGRFLLVPIYMIIMMMPFQATVVPSYLTLDVLNLLNTPLAVVLPQWFMPFSVIMLYLFAIQIPSDLAEAAQIDGAGIPQLIWHIVLPLIKHGIWSIGLLQFIDSWNMLEQPLLFLSSMELMPLSIIIRQSIEINPSSLFVPAMLFMLPVLVVYAMFSKHILNGLHLSIVTKKP